MFPCPFIFPFHVHVPKLITSITFPIISFVFYQTDNPGRAMTFKKKKKKNCRTSLISTFLYFLCHSAHYIYLSNYSSFYLSGYLFIYLVCLYIRVASWLMSSPHHRFFFYHRPMCSQLDPLTSLLKPYLTHLVAYDLLAFFLQLVTPYRKGFDVLNCLQLDPLW